MVQPSIKRIGVVVKPHQPDALQTLCRLTEWLSQHDIKLVGGPEIERRQRVDLPRVRDRRDHAENSIRLVHTRAVVRLDALQVLLDQRDSRDLMRPDCLLDLDDGGLLDMERNEEHNDGHRDHFCGSVTAERSRNKLR